MPFVAMLRLAVLAVLGCAACLPSATAGLQKELGVNVLASAPPLPFKNNMVGL